MAQLRGPEIAHGAAGERAAAFRTAAALVLLGALCWAGSAAAQETQPPGSNDPVTALLEGLKFKAEVGKMPDFVVNSRPPPGSLHYVPVGGPRPEPATRAMSVGEIKAEEAELGALLERHDRIGDRKHKPMPHASAADGRKPQQAKPAPVRCILTCDILRSPKPGAH